MSKQVIALYERSYKCRSLYGYFKGWAAVGSCYKNPSFTMRVDEAVRFDDEHREEMEDVISSLRCTLGYSEMIIRPEEVEVWKQ